MLTIKEQLKDSLIKLGYDTDKVSVDYPTNPEHGDYATNLAMVLAKEKGSQPLELAKDILSELKNDKFIQETFSKIETVKPGFLNFYLKDEYLVEQIGEINKLGDKYGQSDLGQGQKVQVEYISAKPTGPLTLANGRGGFTGDVLANVLGLTGYEVEREYYVNNWGGQIRALGHSVLRDSEAVYKGEYIDALAKRVNGSDAHEVGLEASKIIVEEMIKPSVEEKMNIHFDNWFEERQLHESGEVDKVIAELKEKNEVYEQDGAWWFRSSKYGDDKDRVIIKSDGDKTYLAGDTAYHKNKFKKRGFDKVINIWGADHHGDVARLKAVVEVLGYKGKLDIILTQFVRLIENGKEVKMSKRAGNYIALSELVDEVGADVTRWFFLMRSADTHMDFDLALAREQSKKNPVFYVQYAFVRLASIIEKTKESTFAKASKDKPASQETNRVEKELTAYLLRWPELVEEVAQNYQVHSLTTNAHELADKVQKFYETARVIDNGSVNTARLALTQAAKVVLGNALKVLGINAPENM